MEAATGPLLDAIEARYAVRGPIVAMGASLGGLTSLFAGLATPDRIGGVFAQSGSFFQPRTDGMERRFRYDRRITKAVGEVLRDASRAQPLRIGLTCGSLEGNAANNRDMAAALTRTGHAVSHVEVRDLHTFTAWRDALDPHLTQVLIDAWT